MFDYYNCPYDSDTGPVPCGEKPECAKCSWCEFGRQDDCTGQTVK